MESTQAKLDRIVAVFLNDRVGVKKASVDNG